MEEYDHVKWKWRNSLFHNWNVLQFIGILFNNTQIDVTYTICSRAIQGQDIFPVEFIQKKLP